MTQMSTGSFPLVTIVIPVYNGEKYIREAIESVLAQDYPSIEVIVLNDGSSDDTEEIVKSYVDRVALHTHANIGQAETLNKGWAMARGTILAYLSADDTLCPDAVRKSVTYMQENPDAVLTYCDFNLIDPGSHIIRRVTAPAFSYCDMVIKQICHPGPGVFFKRHAYESAGGWDGSFRQMPDYEYWLRLGQIGNFVRIPEVLAAFRVHEESQTFAKADEAKSDEPVRIISEFYSRKDLPDALVALKDEALSNAFLFSAQLHWRAGRHMTAYCAVKRAFFLCPSNFAAIRPVRMLGNSLFNRAGHRLLRVFKKGTSA